jgi:hypothetical protein
MKKINKLWVSISLIISLNYSFAQTSLGSSKNFLTNLKKDLVNNSAKGIKNALLLKVSEEKKFEAIINFQKADASSEILMGLIKNIDGSSFYMKVVDNLVEGHIILRNTKEAYKYYSDKAGNAFVSKVDINSLICIDYKNIVQNKKPQTEIKTTDMKIAPQLLELQSLPGAAGCVLLDFDGYYMPAGNLWNNGNPINALPSGLSDTDILEHWGVVAEDFRPFNLNITTNEAIFNSYPRTKRMRVVITPTNTAAPGTGGVAFLGSFNWDSDVPCWVFNVYGKIGGETSSHEIGHTFDLQHDGRFNPQETYFYGDSTWAPIMGAAYGAQVGQWSKGEYNYANNLEDDVSIIASPKFGVGFRGDDFGDFFGASGNLSYSSNGTVDQKDGVITSEADIDFFSFNTSGGFVFLNVNAIPKNGNLDLIVRLYNASGIEIATYTNANPLALNANLNANLSAGKYYISVDGIGYGNPSSGGYSAYGSLGSYTITGIIPPSNIQVPAPIYFYYQSDGGGNTFYSKTYYSDIAMYGHTYAGIPFKAYETNVNETVAVHRFYNGEYVNHFYTVNYIDLEPYGYVYEGEEFYAYNYQYPGTVPVYRYYSPGFINHYYTTNFNEYGYGAYGYDYEGIEFYAFPADFSGRAFNNNVVNKKEKRVENNEIIAFPNPTKGLFKLENNSAIIEAIEVTDFFGKKIVNKTINSKKTEIDLSDLSQGIYILKIKSDGAEKVMKIIKE